MQRYYSGIQTNLNSLEKTSDSGMEKSIENVAETSPICSDIPERDVKKLPECIVDKIPEGTIEKSTEDISGMSDTVDKGNENQNLDITQSDCNTKNSLKSRPKLGSLPSFIPFNSSSW